MQYEVTLEASTYSVELKKANVVVDGEKVDFRYQITSNTYLIYIGDKIHRIQVLQKNDTGLTLSVNGKVTFAEVKDEIAMTLAKLGINAEQEAVQLEVMAPMPGVILDILVKEGDHVTKGDPLIILEAMKMENLVKATDQAMVKSLDVKVGQNVEKNSVLITFE